MDRISFKTQLLYVVVFLTRYIDLLTGPFISVRPFTFALDTPPDFAPRLNRSTTR